MSPTASTSPFAKLDPARRAIAVERAKEQIRLIKDVIPAALAQTQLEMARRGAEQALRDSCPPVFHILFDKPSRYKGAHGGRGSAKSWTFARMLVRAAVRRKGLRAVCIREVQKSLEQSVKRLLEDTIQFYNVGHLFRVLNTHIETPGDGIIIFQGMQNHTAESIKSLEGYDIAWVEEAQSLSDTSLTLLRPTLRKEDSEIWFSWNPDQPRDPIETFLRGQQVPPNAIVIKATYKDNPYLPKVLQIEMEWDRSRDPDKYEHVWLGEYERNSEARVFRNWRVEEFETPLETDFLFGGDWGFAVDPSVLVRGFVNGTDLFVDAEAYKVGCEIDDTPALFDTVGCTQNHLHGLEGKCDGMARNWPIVTDSARPETISYMKRHDYPGVTGAHKGKGSIEEGIQFLKNYNIIVHPRCTHVEDELRSYRFKRHPLTNEVLPVLEEKKNHTIDSLRYMVEPIRNPADDWVTW